MSINILSAPINKTASLVVSKGIHYNPNKKIQTADQQTPIGTIEVPFQSSDLTGVRIGRLTVTGYARKGGKWAVRCDCGIYTIRNTKSITNKSNALDRCELCRYELFVRRKYHFSKTGIDKDLQCFDN